MDGENGLLIETSSCRVPSTGAIFPITLFSLLGHPDLCGYRSHALLDWAASAWLLQAFGRSSDHQVNKKKFRKQSAGRWDMLASKLPSVTWD